MLSSAAEVAADLAGLEIVRAGVLQRPVAREPGHGGGEGAVALDTLLRARRPA